MTLAFLFSVQEINVAEQVQQGDLLAPLLFCLAFKEIIEKLSCELNIWFLNDGTLIGMGEKLSTNLALMKELNESKGLSLKLFKC